MAPKFISTLSLKDILKNKTLTKAMVKDSSNVSVHKNEQRKKHILSELALNWP